MSLHISPKPPGKLLRSIQSKLILLLVILILPTLLIEAFIYHERFETRRGEELQANLEIARAVAKGFHEYVQDVLHQELAIGLALTSSQFSPEQRERFIDRNKAEYPTLLNLMWLDPHGIVLWSHLRQLVGKDLSYREYFQGILSGQDWNVSGLYISGGTGGPAFAISRAIRDDRGNLLGIVVASTMPDTLGNLLGIDRSMGASISIFDQAGRMVFKYPSIDITWEQRNWLSGHPEIKQGLISQDVVTTVDSPIMEGKRLAAFTPIHSIGWTAAACRAEDSAMAGIRASLLPRTVVFLLITIAAFGTALLFSRKISGSIEKLRNLALALGKGKGEIPLVVSATAELYDLAIAFNKMSEDLQSRESERREAEQALRESEQRLRIFVEHAPAAIAMFDRDMRYLSASRRWLSDYKLGERDLRGLSHYEVFPEISEGWKEVHRRAMAGEVVRAEADRFERADGSVQWLRWEVRPWHNSFAAVAGIVMFTEDITARQQMEQDLRRSRDELELHVKERTCELAMANEELRKLPSMLLAAQEEERKRLGSELHDSIGQTIVAVKLWVEMALTASDQGRLNEALENLKHVAPTLQNAIKEIRTIYMGLRPTMLDNLGLISTLQWFCREFQNLHPDCCVALQTAIDEESIPKELEVMIFRIAQEALNNVAKHSKAEWVDVSLSRNGHGIELIVSDDGMGINPDRIRSTGTAGSLGLTSMRERAELSGGSFSIESTPGEGTTIRACWPEPTSSAIRSEVLKRRLQNGMN